MVQFNHETMVGGRKFILPLPQHFFFLVKQIFSKKELYWCKMRRVKNIFILFSVSGNIIMFRFTKKTLNEKKKSEKKLYYSI